MAARPSHRPHRDRGPYITLKWHQVELVRFPSQWEKWSPVGGGAQTGLTCPNVALVSLQQHAVRREQQFWAQIQSYAVQKKTFQNKSKD